jgi:hypothetical protein
VKSHVLIMVPYYFRRNTTCTYVARSGELDLYAVEISSAPVLLHHKCRGKMLVQTDVAIAVSRLRGGQRL